MKVLVGKKERHMVVVKREGDISNHSIKMINSVYVYHHHHLAAVSS